MCAREALTVAGVALSLAGCDSIWGLSGEPAACDLVALDDTTPTVVSPAGDFSIAMDRDVLLVLVDGFAYEQPIDALGMDLDIASLKLGVFPISRVGAAPEGDLLFYVAGSAPAVQVATLDAGVWRPDTRPAPSGVDIGAPSSSAFGPRRVLVRERADEAVIQEYVEEGETWTPVGAAIALGTTPNLTSSGLTMVFTGVEEDGTPVVLAASRRSLAEAFDPPQPILHAAGADLRAPHFVGAHCDALYVSVDGELRRYP